MNTQQPTLRHQIKTAERAMARLYADDISVTAMHLGGREPRLYVVMPRTAHPLPGTTYKRKRCDVGMCIERTAHAYGCRIDWEVAQ